VKVGDLVRPKYFGPWTTGIDLDSGTVSRPVQPLGIIIQVDDDGFYVSVLLGGYNEPQPWFQGSLELINVS